MRTVRIWHPSGEIVVRVAFERDRVIYRADQDFLSFVTPYGGALELAVAVLEVMSDSPQHSALRFDLEIAPGIVVPARFPE